MANLVIWQLAKIYAKLKRRLSPRVCHLGLVKLKGGPQKIPNQLPLHIPSPIPPVARSSRRRAPRHRHSS